MNAGAWAAQEARRGEPRVRRAEPWEQRGEDPLECARSAHAQVCRAHGRVPGDADEIQGQVQGASRAPVQDRQAGRFAGGARRGVRRRWTSS